MNKISSYHKAYTDKYYNLSADVKKWNIKDFFFKNIILCFFLLFLPIIFTFILYNQQSYSITSEQFILNNEEIVKKQINYNQFSNGFDKFFNNYKKNKTTIDVVVKNKPIIKQSLPQNLSSFSSYDLPINMNEKKKKFINSILPLVLVQNQKILLQRKRIIEIKQKLNINKTLSKKDQMLVENLSIEYLIKNKNRHKIDVIDDLLISVDIIPNSIVLAQAANESGWGSSRFAKHYNALFGEYTYNDNLGVLPSKREVGKKHLIKFFASYNQSIASYFKNINTNIAYEEFRKIRSLQRSKYANLNVHSLVRELDVYAEDNNYVNTIFSIINTNELEKLDSIKSFATNL